MSISARRLRGHGSRGRPLLRAPSKSALGAGGLSYRVVAESSFTTRTGVPVVSSQLLVETGVPGLLIGLWAALRRARTDPWLFAALAGVLMHTFVEFDFQIPALPVLFVTLAALRG